MTVNEWKGFQILNLTHSLMFNSINLATIIVQSGDYHGKQRLLLVF